MRNKVAFGLACALAGVILTLLAVRVRHVRRVLAPLIDPSFVDAELDRHVARFDVDGVSLPEAIDALRKMTPVPLVIDKSALLRDPYYLGPITAHERDASVGDILDEITQSADYTFFNPAGVSIHITSHRLEPWIHAYDVSDLTRVGITNGSLHSVYYGKPLADSADARGRDLAQLVCGIEQSSNVAWFAAGKLFVLETWQGQREIRRFLWHLRHPIPPSEVSPVPSWDPCRKDWVMLAREDALDRAMRRPIPPLRVEHKTLEQIAAILSEASHVKFIVNHHSLDIMAQEGVTYTVQTDEAPLASVLSQLCDSAARDRLNLSYAVEDGQVILGSKQFCNSTLITKVYDVRDLDSEITPRPPGRESEPPTNTAELAGTLEDAVGPAKEWTDRYTNADGSGGYCVAWPGYLIVGQNWVNQQRVEQFLQSVRSQLHAPRSTGPASQPASPPSTSPVEQSLKHPH